MTSLDRVKKELLDEAAPRPVLLLGAGASVKSGVPAAAGFAEMIARWAFLRELGRSEWDQSIHRSDWLPWLKRLPWYDSATPPEHQYPALVENLLTPREARMQFFMERVRAAPRPSPGYVALAELIAKGWVRTVLTTNFDDIIEQACRANPAALLTTVRSPLEAAAVATTPRYAQLVFLHGTVEHYTDLNLTSETECLASELVDALVPLLRDSPLIVMGYRGAELSIMRDLLSSQCVACNNFRHGIYWCVRAGTRLAPLVEDLARSINGNFLRVEIEGFDEAMLELARDVGHSVRAQTGEFDATLPSKELEPCGSHIRELDWSLLQEKIPLCAARLDLEVPTQDDALVELLVSLNLAVRDGDCIRPTVAGSRVLGKETALEVHLTWETGERTFRGNIFTLLDHVRDALSELNEPYRLKGPRSVDVRAFEPLALKELLVNAVVHRDYEAHGAVRVAVSASAVVFTSPGGVISTIDPERLGRAGVKGYRNQVIANVLFGTGDMDKLGSGLIDVRRWAQEVGADARFSVPSNETFIAELLARPERPTETGQPARPEGSYEVFFANALPVRVQRGVVDVAPCPLTDRRQLWDRYPGVPTGPFLLRGQSLITLEDLRVEPPTPLRQACMGPPESFDLNDYCSDSDHERYVVQLLNESLGRHAGDLGLRVDWGQRRLWFPRGPDQDDDDGTVQVTYTGRVKQSTRTVVKVRRAADGKVIFFEHSALSWQFRRLGAEWHLFLLPGWVFTRDGFDQHLSGRRVTSLSTRRAARDYNANVSAHIFFWAHVLTGGADEVVLRDGGASVALSSQPLTTHLAGMPATPGSGEPSDDAYDDDEDDFDDDVVEALT